MHPTGAAMSVRFLYDPLGYEGLARPAVLGWLWVAGLVWGFLGWSGPVWARSGGPGLVWGMDQAARGPANRLSQRNVFSSEQVFFPTWNGHEVLACAGPKQQSDRRHGQHRP